MWQCVLSEWLHISLQCRHNKLEDLLEINISWWASQHLHTGEPHICSICNVIVMTGLERENLGGKLWIFNCKHLLHFAYFSNNLFLNSSSFDASLAISQGKLSSGMGMSRFNSLVIFYKTCHERRTAIIKENTVNLTEHLTWNWPTLKTIQWITKLQLVWWTSHMWVLMEVSYLSQK